MKKKEKATLRSMKTDELKKRASELHATIASLRLERVTKPAKNVRELYNMRKTLAVTKSILTEKQNEAKKTGQKEGKSV
jgi:ribosomal protein L29